MAHGAKYGVWTGYRQVVFRDIVWILISLDPGKSYGGVPRDASAMRLEVGPGVSGSGWAAMSAGVC